MTHAKQEGVEAQDGAEASGSNQQEKPEEPTMPAVPPATEPARLTDDDLKRIAGEKFALCEGRDLPFDPMTWVMMALRAVARKSWCLGQAAPAPAIEDRAQGAAIRPAVEPAEVLTLWQHFKRGFFGTSKPEDECFDRLDACIAALAVPAVSPEPVGVGLFAREGQPNAGKCFTAQAGSFHHITEQNDDSEFVWDYVYRAVPAVSVPSKGE